MSLMPVDYHRNWWTAWFPSVYARGVDEMVHVQVKDILDICIANDYHNRSVDPIWWQYEAKQVVVERLSGDMVNSLAA